MKKIEDYALLSNCRSAALVDRNGSIEWFCAPRFDSEACFAALLGTAENGYWRIAPRNGDARTTRSYRRHTMILETEFVTPTGRVRLSDCIAMGDDQVDLIRIVEGLEGAVPMQMQLKPRFDYGSRLPLVRQTDDGYWDAVCGADRLSLHTDAQCVEIDNGIESDFTVAQGQAISFQLAWNHSWLPAGKKRDCAALVDATTRYWREWLNACHLDFGDRHPELMAQSVLTLKALTFLPTGGIIAAATASLPEVLGGERNWDYRYCWPRDAAFAIRALVRRTGQSAEIDAWRRWVLRAAAGVPSQVEPLYGLGGERPQQERILDWLEGFNNSRPVRVGNAASAQLQLDMYAAVIYVFEAAEHMGLPRIEESWQLVRDILAHLENIWREPDEGIWEVRGPRRHFTHSKLAVWSAFNCAIRAADALGVNGPVDRWRAMRQAIADDICEKGFDPQLNSFTQFYGSKSVDASLLMLAIDGFLPADDPRIVGTVAAIERELVIQDGWVLRYRADAAVEGLPANGERGFILCTGWLGKVYAMQGRMAEAQAKLDLMAGIANDVGLLAEQFDPASGRQLGNFPQAFSHLSLLLLDLALDPRN